MSVVTAQAAAKLNLALSVGPPEADGMHPICSWMVTVDLFDELTVTRLPADRLSRYAILWHPDAPRPSDIDWSITKDLAVRAHQALERAVGRVLPVQLKLDKRIPVGGGLGGGSADAAAMLRAVNAVHEIGLTDEQLMRIGGTVGADVPFLVRGGSATVEGRGDRVTPHDRDPELDLVVVFPDARCDTAAIYRRFDDGPVATLRPEAVAALVASGPGPDDPFNDLAAPALDAVPALAEASRAVAALAERPAHVTGSGSSLFVLCDDSLHAEALAAAVGRDAGLPSVAVRVHPAAAAEPAGDPASRPAPSGG
jgi:4-diphosphocytidyl-2-C-methyl-D-erythritol kinase